MIIDSSVFNYLSKHTYLLKIINELLEVLPTYFETKEFDLEVDHTMDELVLSPQVSCSAEIARVMELKFDNDYWFKLPNFITKRILVHVEFKESVSDKKGEKKK